ncbi:hypothetical protein AFLA_013555 [Aspergillus flavus NRRL3357]|nr:hypothetical protein AFLA_013555 [Aspergillus flavus NRRL3357]
MVGRNEPPKTTITFHLPSKGLSRPGTVDTLSELEDNLAERVYRISMGEEGGGGILARMGSDLKGKWGVEFGHDLCLVWLLRHLDERSTHPPQSPETVRSHNKWSGILEKEGNNRVWLPLEKGCLCIALCDLSCIVSGDHKARTANFKGAGYTTQALR